MQLQDKSFDGSSTLGDASRDLEAIAGSAQWTTENQPIPYAERRLIETLQFILCGHDICYAVAWQFGSYTAGMGSGYLHVALFIARTEKSSFGQSPPTREYPHILDRTFRIHMGNIISDWRFYTVTLGDTSLPVMVYPIDTIGWDIGPLCNLDFLNFVWDYLAAYSFLKFGIITFPVRDRAKILYVEHHRARSDGWQSTGCAVMTGTYGTIAHGHPRAVVSSACDSHRRSRLAPHMSCST